MGKSFIPNEKRIAEFLLRGNIRKLRRRMRRGADRNFVRRLQEQAAEGGYVKGMRLLVTNLGAHVDVDLALLDVDGGARSSFLLCIAAIHGQLDMIRYLVMESGADVNRTGFDRVTSFHATRTAGGGLLDLAQWLVK
jgi:hypothetical protein